MLPNIVSHFLPPLKSAHILCSNEKTLLYLNKIYTYVYLSITDILIDWILVLGGTFPVRN